jgi:hypothetical protein
VVRTRVRVVVFNATFNNISVILSQTVLLVKKTRKKTTEKLLSHNVVLSEWDSNSQTMCHVLNTSFAD